MSFAEGKKKQKKQEFLHWYDELEKHFAVEIIQFNEF